jgi:hypothetical protein
MENPPAPSNAPAQRTPRHWLWTLFSVLVIIGLLLTAVVYFFGYDAAKGFVESPMGRKAASSGLSKVIKVYGEFTPLHLDGWTITTDSFTSTGWPGEAIGGLNTYGVRGKLDPAAILWEHVYHIKGIQVDHAQVSLLTPNDALKLKTPPKKPKPWYAYFLPSKFVCGPIICPKTELDFEFQKQFAKIHDAHVEADLIDRDFQYTVTSGIMDFPYLPPLRIEKLVMLVTRPVVTVSEARLAAVDPADPARLTLSGSIGMRENKAISANVDVVEMPIEQLLPKELAPLLHGRVSGHLVWTRDRDGNNTVSDGEVSMSGAGIRDLSVFKQLALLHGNPDLENFDFDTLTVKFHRENGIFKADLVANASGKFSLTGGITYEFETKLATLDLAFKDLPLKTWLPSDFKPRYSGVATATMKWRGRLDSVKESSGAVSVNLDGTQINDPALLRQFLATKGLRAPNEINFKTAQLDFAYEDETFHLTRAQLDAPGFLTIGATGTLTMPENDLKAEMNWQGLILQDWLPTKMAKQISGIVDGTAQCEVTKWQYKDGSYGGDLRLESGKLTHTNAQALFARFVNDRKLLEIPLKRAQCSWNFADGGLAVHSLDLRAGDDIGVQGDVVATRSGKLSGLVWVGLNPIYLPSLMGLGDNVFTRKKDGLLWAKVNVSGSLRKPEQDLGKQLIGQLGSHPLAIFGLAGKGISWYAGNLFGEADDWKRPSKP